MVFVLRRRTAIRLVVHVLQTRRNGQKPVPHRLLQHHLGQVLRPGWQNNGIGKGCPFGQLIRFLGQKPVHHCRFFELKPLVEDHRHHLGAEFHHLQQKAEFLAPLGQALAQHVPAFRVKRQIIDFSLVGRAQFVEEGGNAHVAWFFIVNSPSSMTGPHVGTTLDF